MMAHGKTFFSWMPMLGLLVVVLSVAMPLRAQERDPTQPPAEAGAMVNGPGGAVQSPWGTEGMVVLVRDGKRFLVVGTRLYAPGQKVGQFQIDRITETEVWLREGGVLRKVPRFSGIERKETAVAPQGAASAPKAKAAKTTKKAKAP